jgi:tRNA A-37 threonylcarbamoyl transferase component Bud32/tetratricopeptide (TPR) repeat protein
LVDGTLSPAERSSIDEHLDSCAACFALLADLERARSAVDAAPVAVPRELAFPAALGERYTILETIGVGAMGVVYAAFDRTLDRKIAIKSLHPRLRADERLTQRLGREAQALAKLSHPNVVAVHDIVIHDDIVFLAMDFVPGKTLQRWLESASAGRSTREILAVFIQAGRGLAAAHAAGIVHRDFKPSNVIIGEDGRVCVIDFGLAAWGAIDPPSEAGSCAPTSGEITRTGTVLGTPAYMSPEQTRGESLDARCDQYSFCVAVHEALFGVRPTHTEPSVQADAVTRASKPVGPVGRRIRRAIARGLQVERESRYPSMDALLVDLAERPVRRRWAVAGLALAGAGGWVIAYHGAAPGDGACRGSEAQLLGIWDDARKAQIEGAFLATGKPFAADAWRGTSTTIDRYARAWVTTRTDACEATRKRGEQSEQLLDLRMSCLDDRKTELAALSDVLLHADGDVVKNALAASSRLAGLGPCSDARALASRTPPQASPEITKQRDEVKTRLAQVKALDAAGKYEAGLAVAAEIDREAQATNDPGMRASATFWHGTLQAKRGDPAAADTLQKSVTFADAAGDDRTRLAALSELLNLSSRSVQFESMRTIHEQAAAVVQRLGPGDEDRVPVLGAFVSERATEGKFDDARVVAEELVALERKLHGEGSWQLGWEMSRLGTIQLVLGHDDRALELAQRALAILVSTLGSEHPDLAQSEQTIASVLNDQNKYAEAEGHFRRAAHLLEEAMGANSADYAVAIENLASVVLAQRKYEEVLVLDTRALSIQSAIYPADSSELIFPLLGLGEAYLGLNDPVRARPFLERALALSPGTSAMPVAEAKFVLAKALDASGADPSRAGTLAKEAKATLESSRGDHDAERRLTEITGWLANRSGRFTARH